MNTRRLRAEIVANFETQKAFGKSIGWDQNKVSKMLTGKYVPDVDEAAVIAVKLQLRESTYREIFLHEISPNGYV